MSLEGKDFPQYQFPGKGCSSGRKSILSQGSGSLKAGHDKDGENEAGICHSRVLTALLIYTSRCLDICSWAAAITGGLCHSETSKEVERKSCLSRQEVKISKPYLSYQNIQSQLTSCIHFPFVVCNSVVLKFG